MIHNSDKHNAAMSGRANHFSQLAATGAAAAAALVPGIRQMMM